MSERETLLASAKQAPLLEEEGIGEVSLCFVESVRSWLETAVSIKLPRSANGPQRCWAVELSVTGAVGGVNRPAKKAKGAVKRTKTGVYLFVYEEVITERTSTCDQCRIIGWGTHPVSWVRYHFIIPAETGPDSLSDPNSLVAITDAARRGVHPGGSFSLPSKPSMEGVASTSTSYGAQATIFDSIKHRLHGVIHANGYGHLLRINGVYGGSSRITGLQIFALWDALCDRLNAMSVTVEDVSSKSGMELRIAYLMAYGCTWYGLLGYVFGRGPYNITEKRWTEAGTYISSMNLSQLIHDFIGVESRVVAVIQRYCLPVSGAVEVRDFGALMYRLMYLQLNPDQAGPFFDRACIEEARGMCTQRKVGEMPVKRKKKAHKFTVVKKKWLPVGVGGDAAAGHEHGEEDDVAAEGVDGPQNGRSRSAEVSVGAKCKSTRGGNESVDVKSQSAKQKLATKGKMALKGRTQAGKAVQMKNDVLEPSANQLQLGMLRYKAVVGNEFMDRARMLLRSIRSLIPCSREALDDAVATEEEMEEMLSKLVEGPGSPEITFQDTWFEFLPEMLRWAQRTLGFRGVDAGAAVKITGSHRDTVEIDKGFLHRIKMYPETWVLPLKKATILQYNGLEREGVKITEETPDTNAPPTLGKTGSAGVLRIGRALNKEKPGKTITGAAKTTRKPPVLRPASKKTGNTVVKKEEDSSATDMSIDEDSRIDEEVLELAKSRPQKRGMPRETRAALARREALSAPTTVDEYVKQSVDITVDSLWRSAVCPSDDEDAPAVPRAWHNMEPGSDVDDPSNLDELRQQITADLHLLFMCTLKLYIPNVAKIAGHNAAVELGQKHVAKIVKGKHISREAGVLRDTKHFVKTYRSSGRKQMVAEIREPGVHGHLKAGTIRVCASLVMPEELTSPDTSTRSGKKAMLPVNPPAEIIDMPASASVGELLHVATSRFGDMYALCKRFKAVGAYVSVEKEENPKHPMKKPPSVTEVFLEESIKLESLLSTVAGKPAGKQQPVLPLEIVGAFGNEVKIGWMLHAGGAQDWTVNCPCGTTDDDGAEMVACTKCETWFHTRCVKPDAPDTAWAKGYTCNRCMGIQILK